MDANGGPTGTLLAWTVVALNAAYLALLIARVAARRPAAAEGSAAEPVARTHIASPKATAAIVLMSATAAVYYSALLLWLVYPAPLGPPLTGASPAAFAAGLLLSLGGLALMAWTYAVFRSWRWRAEIDPGHQLMTRGPFRMIRHPIYLSFALFYLGAFVLLPYAVFLLHAVVSFLAYDYRARTEERVMLEAFGDAYRAYRDRTWRYVPGVY